MLKLLALLVVFFLASCASSKSASGDSEKTNDVMITFVTKAQSGFWREAMENVSPEERDYMIEGGQVMQEYRDAVNRIRLSTIKNMDLTLDRKGRLVGLKNLLDESNEHYRASDEKVVIDPNKLKDLSVERIKREKAEAEEKLQEEPELAEQIGQANPTEQAEEEEEEE